MAERYENLIETVSPASLRYDKDGLIPAVVQHYISNAVLMVAYMNAESLQKTLETGETWFFSRSRQELWHKGGTSGNIQSVISVAVDCDEDTLVIKVNPAGPACHTGAISCFYRALEGAPQQETDPSVEYLYSMETEIKEKHMHPVEKSYTSYLLQTGTDKICKKIGEEAAEVIIGAKNKDPQEIISESADLLYHLQVLWEDGNVTVGDVMSELNRRTAVKGNKKTVGHLDKTF